MRPAALTALVLAATLSASAAQAAPLLLAVGTLGGGTDLSGLTGALENGLPGNILGGLGSGLAYVGGNTFLALPDRGPNATPYNSKVDDTVSYISRFQTVNLALTPSTGGPLRYTLTPTLTNTTLLYSPTALTYGSGQGLASPTTGKPLPSGIPAQNTSGKNYFTGRSDNYGSGTSGNPTDARFDPESIRVSNDGRSVFISDEYGPYVRQFDRASGQLLKTYTLPANLDIANKAPTGDAEIGGNAAGRTANKGMEGLAITPDGKTLVGILQANLLQDPAGLVRIVTIDVATGATHEYAYTLTTGSGVSEIVAINDHQFLVDERDGKGLGDGSKAKVKQLYEIDLAGAVDVTGTNGTDAAKAAVGKSLFLDVADALETQDGLKSSQVPAKIEGLSFGQDIVVDGALEHTLYIANDNDFLPGTAGGNQFFVFGVTDADLKNYVAQQVSAVPLPAGLPLFAAALGALGCLGWRRKGARA